MRGACALTPSSKHAVHGCTHVACHVVCGTAAQGCAGCHVFDGTAARGCAGVVCFGARCTWMRAMHAVDAHGCMPHAEAAREDACRAWIFLRLHRSP
eukprot:2014240-Alexandrium_andersonii.AAC.1